MSGVLVVGVCAHFSSRGPRNDTVCEPLSPDRDAAAGYWRRCVVELRIVHVSSYGCSLKVGFKVLEASRCTGA